ncbi:MAG: hypothetical protein HYS62_02905 [Candidatus Aenigmarchaeota archaeon]|nr:hypothetical protein [Candidatus Aenigmarchaeota archaeon]
MIEEKFFILGALMGDGCLTSRPSIGDFTIEFDQKCGEWLEMLSEKFRESFGKTSDVRRTSKGFFRLRIHSKQIFKELEEMKKKLPEIVLTSDDLCKTKFLQGIFDAEGSVHKTRFRITFSNKRDMIIKTCQTLLQKFDISTGKVWISKGDVKILPIFGRDRLEKFQRSIGFTHPEKKSKLELILT